MNIFGVLLAKELSELRRTRRGLIVPLMIAFFAISGPILARVVNQLIGSSLPAGVTLPDPTYLDAWGQWAKNLSQLGVLVLVATLGGSVASEVRQGTALLVLTKPVSRTAFILAKLLANWIVLGVATALGMLITAGLTSLLFPGADWKPLLRATLMWLVLAAMMSAITIAFSAALPSTGAAIGAAIGVVIALSVMGAWSPAATHSPAGLGIAMAKLAAGEQPAWHWPVVTAIALAALCWWWGAVRFKHREL